MRTFVFRLMLVSVWIVTMSRGAEPQKTTTVRGSSSSSLAIHHHGSLTEDFIPQRRRRQPLPSNRATRYFAAFLGILGGVLLMLGIFGSFDVPNTQAVHQPSNANWVADITTTLTEVEPVFARLNRHVKDFMKYGGIFLAASGLVLYLCTCVRQLQQGAGNRSIGAPHDIEMGMLDPPIRHHYHEPPPLYGSAEMENAVRSLPPPPSYESVCNAPLNYELEAVQVASLAQPVTPSDEAITEGASADRPMSPPPSSNASSSPPSPSLRRESAKNVNVEEDTPS